MQRRAFITGLAGTVLSADERAFVRQVAPWGVILFARNVDTPDQVRRLVDSVRECAGCEDLPVLVDQEGGRVQRLGPPHWPAYPCGAVYGRLYDIAPERGLAAARLGARLIAADLLALGITVDCVPLADVPVSGADPVIGDRAYGLSVETVSRIANAIAAGLISGGVLPVLKHLPGHGRATADSHQRLPVVDTDRATLERTDFAAFRPLAHLPCGMTAHVVFSAVDSAKPATTSVTIVSEVIRGSIGFQGLLMSDDVSMGALSGTIRERVQLALGAGCDLVLHCNGNFAEMQEVAHAAPPLTGAAAARAAAALSARPTPDATDLDKARVEFQSLLAAASP